MCDLIFSWRLNGRKKSIRFKALQKIPTLLYQPSKMPFSRDGHFFLATRKLYSTHDVAIKQLQS